MEQEFQQRIIDSEEANEIWEYIKEFYGLNSGIENDSLEW